MRESTSIPYRPDIDGLRAIAVSSVVAYHAAPGLVRGGFVGVDVFFVISGYLISTIILRQQDEGRFSIADFYARRIKRLFPALIVVIAVTWLIGWYLLLPHEFRALGKHIAAGAAYFLNFTLRKEAGYFDAAADEKPLLHLWSLAVEEQFYIVWPILLLLIRGRGATLAALTLITLASLTSNIVTIGKDSAAAFYLPQNRFWELSSGALLAFANLYAAGSASGRWRAQMQRLGISPEALCNAMSCCGLGLIVGAAFGLDDHAIYPGVWALLPCTGALLLIGARRDAVINRLLLARPAMVFIGLISYPLYLWHWPLLSFTSIFGHGEDWTYRFAAVAIALVLACATYFYVERPLRHLAGRALPATMMGVTLSFCLAGFLATKSVLKPRLNDRPFQDIGDAISDWRYPKGLTPTRTATGLVVHTAGQGAEKVLYFGDSNMQQYWPRIEQLVSTPRAGKQVVFATSGGCPPIPGVHEKGHRNCEGLTGKVMNFANDPNIKTVVIGAAWLGYLNNSQYVIDGEAGGRLAAGTPPWTAAFSALEKMIRELRAEGKAVWLVLNIPGGQALAPISSLRRSLSGETALLPLHLDRLKFEKSWGPIKAKLIEAAASGGAEVIDPMETLCDAAKCPGQTTAGTLMYKDGGHLRASYVRDHATFMDRTLGSAGKGAVGSRE